MPTGFCCGNGNRLYVRKDGRCFLEDELGIGKAYQVGRLVYQDFRYKVRRITNYYLRTERPKALRNLESYLLEGEELVRVTLGLKPAKEGTKLIEAQPAELLIHDIVYRSRERVRYNTQSCRMTVSLRLTHPQIKELLKSNISK